MIKKSVYVLDVECDGPHKAFWRKRKPQTLHAEGKSLTECRTEVKKKGGRLHEGKHAGKVSCPKCTRPRSVFQEFPGEHQ